MVIASFGSDSARLFLARMAGLVAGDEAAPNVGAICILFGCVDFVAFLQLYIAWNAAVLCEELAERPYITLGFSAWLQMLPLAFTSTRYMQRRLRHNIAALASNYLPRRCACVPAPAVASVI
jgi:hypothetical protein